MYSAIRFRSATYTFRARQALERAGITSMVIRAPGRVSGEGCGYMLKVKSKDLPRVLEILERQRIAHQEVFAPWKEGTR
ncbi:MAG: DUF3343 domain-containing protein [Eubacteriales bacterium]|jgi:hypothetical protein